MLHNILEALHFDFFNAFESSLLCVDAIEDVLLRQDIQDSANGLEVDWLVAVEQLGKAPSLEGVVAPDEQVGTLVDLSNCHGGATLHIDVVDIGAEVVNNFVLALDEARLNGFRFDQPAKQNWTVSLFELLVVSQLGKSVVPPDEQSLLRRYGARVDHTCSDASHVTLEENWLGVLKVTKLVWTEAKFALTPCSPTEDLPFFGECQIVAGTARDVDDHMIGEALNELWLASEAAADLLPLPAVQEVLAPEVDPS